MFVTNVIVTGMVMEILMIVARVNFTNVTCCMGVEVYYQPG